MFTSLKIFPRMLAATLAIAGLLLPAVAYAQYEPSYGQPQGYGQPPQGYGQPPQGYGQPQYGQPQGETIHGRIYSINATFNITVTDDNGYMDNVDLHQGTIINPTGLTLAPGMEVTIAGYGNGSAFEAMEIDTPYSYAGPAPVPIYYGPGWWYPGFGYGYGPSFVLDFVFFGGGYRFDRHDFGGGGFDRNFWAVRSDDRFRGRNGFAPRTAPQYQRGGNWSNGNRGSWSNGNGNRNDNNRTYTPPTRTWNGSTNYNGNRNDNSGYTAPTRTWNGNTNGNANYSGNRNNNSGYTAPTRTWNGNTNGNANYSGNRNNNSGYTAPTRTWNGNTNGNANYSARGGGNANYGARNGGNTSGNTGYRSAPESRPAYTRSAGSNESRSTRTSDDGNNNHGDHSRH
jgi:hypothetical protein